MVEIQSTLGALLAGGLVATGFSGVVTTQTLAYFKLYSLDLTQIKFLVLSVWLLDFGHTIFVSASVWHYLILHFGNTAMIDSIPGSLAMTIAFTAVLTFLVHCFFVHRIFKLSKNNWFIALPLAIMAIARLCFACLTTAQMIILDSLAVFIRKFHWSFTLGLVLSATLDILITGCMCLFLSHSRKASSSLNHVVDTLMLYAFENGSLTCAATFVSLVCWLAMPRNLIFMGLHFVISKFYANSLLATLNTRKDLQASNIRHGASGSGDRFPVVLSQDFRPRQRSNIFTRVVNSFHDGGKTGKRGSQTGIVHINVEKTVECTVDEGMFTAKNSPV